MTQPRLSVRLLAMLLSGLLSLIFVEMAVAVLQPSRGYAVSPGPDAEYEITTAEFTHTVKTNNLNFRGGAFPPRRPGQTRILALGDSFTFGLGVELELAYPSLLERKLQPVSSGRVVVLNGGGRGAFAGGAFDILREYNEVFDPDLVVVQVYIGNDFYDAIGSADPDASQRDIGDLLDRRDEDRRSLLRAVTEQVRKLRSFDLLFDLASRVGPIDRYLVRRGWRWDTRHLLLTRPPALEQALFRIEVDALTEMAAWLDQRGVPTVVLVIPFREQGPTNRRTSRCRKAKPPAPRSLVQRRHPHAGHVPDLPTTRKRQACRTVLRERPALDGGWTRARSDGTGHVCNRTVRPGLLASVTVTVKVRPSRDRRSVRSQ